jgi:RNA polymerase sigma-70 factor (ECF subfamily)
MLSVGPSTDECVPADSRPGPDEAELVRRAQLGSVAAFEQLVLGFGPRVHRYLVLRVRDDGAALDALQETLTAAWQGLPGLKDPAKFWPWLLGIAAHKAADAARDRMPASDDNAEPAELEEEGSLEIREALSALPAHYREVLLLRYFVRLSEEEVAEALGVRVGTVKSRSARARRALLELLG